MILPIHLRRALDALGVGVDPQPQPHRPTVDPRKTAAWVPTPYDLEPPF